LTAFSLIFIDKQATVWYLQENKNKYSKDIFKVRRCKKEQPTANNSKLVFLLQRPLLLHGSIELSLLHVLLFAMLIAICGQYLFNCHRYAQGF
jgi:hypothetical protein